MNINLPYFIGFIVLSWLPWVWLVVNQDYAHKNRRFYWAVGISLPCMEGMLWAIGVSHWGLLVGALVFALTTIANLAFITYCTRCGKQDRGLNFSKKGYLCDFCGHHLEGNEIPDGETFDLNLLDVKRGPSSIARPASSSGQTTIRPKEEAHEL